MRDHLIIMAKPPILGKAKTRLAKDLGDKMALEFYKEMLGQTFNFSKEISCVKTVHFTEPNEYTEMFQLFEKDFQIEGDLGRKMAFAFAKEFEKGAGKVVMIGSDCPDNSSENIKEAFDTLNNKDVVFGPSDDGGYYLIGMKKLHDSLFENKKWSTATVYQEAIDELNKINLTYSSLPFINDIDTLVDLKNSKFYETTKTIM